MLHRWSRPRLSLARAIAADGKRIRGANRNGDGHHETVTLVDHVTGAPFAILGYNDDGGEIAALNDLLLRCDIRGRIITVDALHTTRETARLITERCGADYVLNVKGNASETFALLDSIDWERDRDRAHVGESEKQHGRIEQRSIDVLAPLKGMVNFPGVRQIARVTRYREVLEDGKEPGNETVYPITSLDSATASAADLLALNRGHWEVENNNHRQRDCNFGEDACLTHTGNGPLNRACLNTIALAVIFATRCRHPRPDPPHPSSLQQNRSDARRGVRVSPFGQPRGRKAPNHEVIRAARHRSRGRRSAKTHEIMPDNANIAPIRSAWESPDPTWVPKVPQRVSSGRGLYSC